MSDLAAVHAEFVLPPEAVEAIAERTAEIVLAVVEARNRAGAELASPYLTVPEAAALLRAKPQRVYDLLSARRLSRYKDGARVLVAREELDAYLVAKGSSRIAPALPQLSPTRFRRRIAT